MESNQDSLQYERIAQAIAYLNEHFRSQPSLDELAAQVHLSPFHFQRLFTEWAGVSPKQFLQYLSVEYAKDILKKQSLSLSDTAEATGLSGTGRLHDLFVKIEGMTPGEYKNGGADLQISYHFAVSPFGRLLIANTEKGVCSIAFGEEQEQALHDLKTHFPKARLQQKQHPLQEQVLTFFTKPGSDPLRLHLRGTAFQLKVWEALLKIPMGQLSTYGDIARQIDQPNAARAVGTAIGSNPIAFIIPCHRVIRSSGVFGGYMWGPERKSAIIGWEAAKTGAPGL
ncbi:MAG: methylated-DNA--[protein]-cysteine S-methyltransferase [Chitinophagaceae bacterium]|nr:methylated-DNA--[protein]-cysteine S-methyltransferase [Chitinophagaceae bacterium]